MTGSTPSDRPSPRHATQPEAQRIVRALILGAALGLVLRLLGRRDQGSMWTARR